MDDFYAACREKIQNAADTTVAISELAAINLFDLPKIQIRKFAEQSVTLLSVISQVASGSSQDMTIQFKQIRQQLDATLNYLEQIMEAEKEFPPSQQSNGCWW